MDAKVHNWWKVVGQRALSTVGLRVTAFALFPPRDFCRDAERLHWRRLVDLHQASTDCWS